MKYIILFFTLFLSGVTIAQNRKVDLGNESEAFQTRLYAEGMPIYAVYRSSNSVWTANTTTFYSGAPTPGTAWYVENVSISADTALSASIQFSYVNIVPSGKVSPLWTVTFPKTGGAQNFAFNRFIYEGTAINASAQASGGKSTSQVRGGVVATKVSSDFNKKADRVLMLIMDSIGDGINTDAAGNDTYTFLLRDSLETATGKKWRIVNKCLSGATSSHLEVARQTHQLEPAQVDLIYYAMGMNDTDPAVYQTNLTKMIAWKKRIFPLAPMIVAGVSPGADASKEATLSVTRANAQSVVTANASDPRISYVNLGNAWNYATQQGTYTADGTHPNALGHALLYGRVKTAITQALVNYLK